MLTTLEMPQEDTVGLRIDGEITEADISRVTTTLQEKLGQQRPIRFYVEYEAVDNFSLDMLFQDATFKAQYLDDFKKGAIVTDKSWFEQVVKISNYFTTMDIKAFDFAEKEEALRWLAT